MKADPWGGRYDDDAHDLRPAYRGGVRSESPRWVADALDLARRGLRVFPLMPGTKEPLFKGYKERATSDSETILGWGDAYPDCNLGMMIDRDFVVLDVDLRSSGAESLRELLSGHPPFVTAEALTGSGGSHYLFRVGDGARIRSQVGWRPGLDILCDGRYIVVEPSVHPDTQKEYVWTRLPSRQAIEIVPDWFVELLSDRADRPGNPTGPTGMIPIGLTQGATSRAFWITLSVGFPSPVLTGLHRRTHNISGPGLRLG